MTDRNVTEKNGKRNTGRKGRTNGRASPSDADIAIVTLIAVALAAVATVAIEVLGRPKRGKGRPRHLKLVPRKGGRK